MLDALFPLQMRNRSIGLIFWSVCHHTAKEGKFFSFFENLMLLSSLQMCLIHTFWFFTSIFLFLIIFVLNKIYSNKIIFDLYFINRSNIVYDVCKEEKQYWRNCKLLLDDLYDNGWKWSLGVWFQQYDPLILCNHDACFLTCMSSLCTPNPVSEHLEKLFSFIDNKKEVDPSSDKLQGPLLSPNLPPQHFLVVIFWVHV